MALAVINTLTKQVPPGVDVRGKGIVVTWPSLSSPPSPNSCLGGGGSKGGVVAWPSPSLTVLPSRCLGGDWDGWGRDGRFRGVRVMVERLLRISNRKTVTEPEWNNWIGIASKADSLFSLFSIVKRSVLFCFVFLVLQKT